MVQWGEDPTLLQLLHRFDSRPGNFHMPLVGKKQNRNSSKISQDTCTKQYNIVSFFHLVRGIWQKICKRPNTTFPLLILKRKCSLSLFKKIFNSFYLLRKQRDKHQTGGNIHYTYIMNEILESIINKEFL